VSWNDLRVIIDERQRLVGRAKDAVYRAAAGRVDERIPYRE
jgi:hypothetical protein